MLDMHVRLRRPSPQEMMYCNVDYLGKFLSSRFFLSMMNEYSRHRQGVDDLSIILFDTS